MARGGRIDQLLARAMQAQSSSQRFLDTIFRHRRLDEAVVLEQRRHRGTRARVVAVTGYLLIVEIEAPSDGFLRPDGRVGVAIGEDVFGVGTIDPIDSSPRGPHAKGLLLRLVIGGTSGWTCRVGDEVWITGGETA